MPDEWTRYVKQYESQRAGHDHEWTILVSRMAAYLTSQSLFATGAALIENGSGPTNNHDAAMVFMSFMGAAISVLASIAIAINCRVLIQWHKQIQEFIRNDEGSHLSGMYMPRGQPDWMHRLSVDFVSILIPVIGGTAWFIILAAHKPALIKPCALFWVFWVEYIAFLYFLSKIKPPK